MKYKNYVTLLFYFFSIILRAFSLKKIKFDKLILIIASTYIIINILSLNNAFTINPGSGTSSRAVATSSSSIVANLPGNVSFVNSSIMAYIQYVKNGITQKFYTSYLPPVGTYNDDVSFEHTLPACDVLAGDPLSNIGNDCMIKIPFDCSRASNPSQITDSKRSGVNCLDYGSLFSVNNSKKLSPNVGLTINKPYCHQVQGQAPMLIINCKLAPCNAIPNIAYRRPGVNCLADCNLPAGSGIGYSGIAKNDFYFEGFNCLKSCDMESSPSYGNNCVLKHKGYVMPLCSSTGLTSVPFYNLATTNADSRIKCIDFSDMRICRPTESNNHLKTCVNSGTNGGFAINPQSTRKCYHGYLNINYCEKINCSDLTKEELSTYVNSFNFNTFSSENNFCIADEYTKFSYEQINVNSSLSDQNKKLYLTNYTLPSKPCESIGDTEENVKVLSSNFFVQASTNQNIFLDAIKQDCIRSNRMGCNTNNLNSAHSSYKPNLLYDLTSRCQSVNASQAILCTDYKRFNPPKAPYDCNAKNGLEIIQQCPTNLPHCYCGSADVKCYKHDINCNLSVNQVYPVCRLINTAYEIPKNDTTVSWFFRPSIHHEALKSYDVGGVTKYKLVNMRGYPTESRYNPRGDDFLEMSSDDIEANGFIDQFRFCVVPGVDQSCTPYTNNGIVGRSTVPSVWGTADSVRALGPANLCGVNSNYRNPPSDDFAYYKGEVVTSYGLDNSIIHEVEICLRYVGSLATFTSCGRRKCYANCTAVKLAGGNGTCRPACGYDNCKKVKVVTNITGRAADNEKCSSDSDSFNENYSTQTSSGRNSYNKIYPKCVSDFQDSLDRVSENIRVRAYKPNPASNYICSVIEIKGIVTGISGLADIYFRGDEYFLVPVKKYEIQTINGVSKSVLKTYYKKLCVSGTFVNSTGQCENGFDTTQDNSDSEVWRTLKIVRYIQSPPKSDGSRDETLTQVGKENLFTLASHGDVYVDQYGFGGGEFSSTDPNSVDITNKTIGRTEYNKRVYLDKSDCIKHELKLSSPVMHIKATSLNSSSLFIPTIQIDTICSEASAPGSLDCSPRTYTDFYRPAIKVLWGMKDSRYPLNSSTSSESNYKLLKFDDINTEKTGDYLISLKNAGFSSELDIKKYVFLKKEYSINKEPILCLYEKPYTAPAAAPAAAPAVAPAATPAAAPPSGVNVIERKVKCVPRARANKALITLHSNSYNNLGLNLKFNDDSYAIRNNSTGSFVRVDNFSDPQLQIVVPNVSNQGNPLTISRDECSILNFECIDNEKDLLNLRNTFPLDLTLIRNKEIISNYCKNILLKKCNKLKNIAITDQVANTLNPDATRGFNKNPTASYYGWYNEFCIVGGLSFLDDINSEKYVVENIPVKSDGTLDEDAKGNCEVDRNGACLIYNKNEAPIGMTQNQRFVKATPHQLGLCVAITSFYPTCQPIVYGINSDPNDLYFTSSPYLATLPANLHSSHSLRSNPANSHHADFEIAYAGNTGVKGVCRGFYKLNEQYPPTANCSGSSNPIQFSNFNSECQRYSCPSKMTESYGAESDGSYLGDYNDNFVTMKSLIGSNDGFALWRPYTKTNDLKEMQTAVSCMVGYKKTGSTPVLKDGTAFQECGTDYSAFRSNIASQPYSADVNKMINSVNKCITSYSGGSNPTRYCNQIGIWESVTNPCERIKCPTNVNLPNTSDAGAFNMDDFNVRFDANSKVFSTQASPHSDNPSKIFFVSKVNVSGSDIRINASNDKANASKNLLINSNISIVSSKKYVFEKTGDSWQLINSQNDDALQKLWDKFGGAVFAETNAIRSNRYYYNADATDLDDQHTVSGTCNTAMGYRSIGSNNPQLACDHNGNLLEVRYRCVADCSAVNDPVAADEIHGSSTWQGSSVTAGDISAVVSSQSCSAGFVPYPYSPLNDEEGTKGDFATDLTGDAILLRKQSDGVASSSNNSEYVATGLPASSPANLSGRYYNLKISKASQSSSAEVSLINRTSEVVGLFSPNPYTINAGTGNVISKINFVSYGNANYFTYPISINSNCHQQYSKIILAQKCIGKSSCTISLSDFENYDEMDSDACSTNLGNGLNGQASTNVEVGGAGGGGGGNSNALGGSNIVNGSNVQSVRSINGSSYCDSLLHVGFCRIINEFDANFYVNKGLKLDHTKTLADCDGKNGIIEIWLFSEPSATIAMHNQIFSSSGVHEYTIPAPSAGKVDNMFYVKYTMSGGGGGGGGSGEIQGTDGFSGSRITGMFKVESGKTVKFYVGGGGKSGKSYCPASADNFDGISSKIYEIIPNSDINIKYANNSKSDNNINHTNNSKSKNNLLFNKIIISKLENKNNIFNKISKLFIDDAMAQCSRFQQLYSYNINGVTYSYCMPTSCWGAGCLVRCATTTITGMGTLTDIASGDTLTCNQPNFDGTTRTASCTSGGAITFSSANTASCGCASGFVLSGTSCVCPANTTLVSGVCTNNCTTTTITGMGTLTSKKNGDTLTCNQPNFDGTTRIASCSAGGAITFSSANTASCGCASGFVLSGTSCACPANTTLVSGVCQPNCDTTTITGMGTLTSKKNGDTLTCNQPNFDGTTRTASCSAGGAITFSSANTASCACVSGYSLVGSNCQATCANTNIIGMGTLTGIKNGDTLTCNQSNFDGTTRIASCSAGGAITFSSANTASCACVSGHSLVGSNCIANCTTTTITGMGTLTGIKNGDTLTCNQSNFDGTTRIASCSAGGAITFSSANTASCACVSGYSLVGSNCQATCANTNIIGMGTLTGIKNGDTLTCNQSNFDGTTRLARCLAGGSISFADHDGTSTADTDPCACASGYTKNASNNCVKICDDFTIAGVAGTLTGKKTGDSINCDVDGYTGSFTLTCGLAGAYSVSQACTAYICNIPAGTGYPEKRNLIASGTFNCDEGYYGTVNYICNSGSSPATVSSNCVRIKCTMPDDAYANISDPSGKVDYANEFTNYNCLTNYVSPLSGYAQYKCTGNPSGSGDGVIEVINKCELPLCSHSIYGSVQAKADGSSTIINCLTYPGLFGTAEVNCDSNRNIVYSRDCQPIACLFPSNFNADISNYAEINAGDNYIKYSPLFQNLNCKTGYYYRACAVGETLNCGTPQYKCEYNAITTTSANLGVLTTAGACLQTRCDADNYLNSVIDETKVNYSLSLITTSCKIGYVQNQNGLPPKYRCSGSGDPATYYSENPCEVIKCSISGVRGVNDSENLEFGTNKTIACNQNGWTGTITYNCSANGNSVVGTFSLISNNCKLSICEPTMWADANAFSNLIQNSQVSGGSGGVISATHNFLKGGNGGASINQANSGSGGGAGSASMIEIDNRIIAIAGGGGGGNGGGTNHQSFTIQHDQINNQLFSNIYGKYLIADLEYTKVPSGMNAENVVGVFYAKSNDDGSFRAEIPSGAYVREILFSSYGNPSLPNDLFSSPVVTPVGDDSGEETSPAVASPAVASPVVTPVGDDSGEETSPAVASPAVVLPSNLKYGTCNASNSLNVINTLCLNKISCNIANVNSLSFTNCSPAIASPKLGVMGIYFYREPTLSVNGNTAFKIKEMIYDSSSSSYQYVDPVLENDEVYSFILVGDDSTPSATWVKINDISDRYELVSPSASLNSRYKVKFPQQNQSFKPILKIVDSSGDELLSSKEIFKYLPDNTTKAELSKGYIKTDTDYIISLISGNSWSIRKYVNENALKLPSSSRVLPKRTCMVVKSSDQGALGVSWSGTNSRCVRKCPGYNKTTQVGDDRIGVGVTKHRKSDDSANYYKVAWDEADFNSWQVKEFNGSVTNNFFNSVSETYKPTHYSSSRSGSHFILARKCSADGSWEEPVILCPGYSEGDPESVLRVNSSRSYVSSAFSLNNYGTSKNYIQANNPSEYFSTTCINGYLQQTKSKFYSGDKYANLRFICTNNSGTNNFVDKTYLFATADDERRDCVKYCSGADFTHSTAITVSDSIRVRASGYGGSDGQVSASCASGFLPSVDASGNRSGALPVVTCSGNDDAPIWSTAIANDCSAARGCGIYSKTNPGTKEANFGMVFASQGYIYVPFINYMSRSYLDRNINHGEGETFTPDTSKTETKYGRCGYVEQKECPWWGCYHEFRRVYFKSWSCNDGHLSYDYHPPNGNSDPGGWNQPCGNAKHRMKLDHWLRLFDESIITESAIDFIKNTDSVPVP